MRTKENLILWIYSLTRFAARPSPFKDLAGWHLGYQHIWRLARGWPDIHRLLVFFISLIIKLTDSPVPTFKNNSQIPSCWSNYFCPPFDHTLMFNQIQFYQLAGCRPPLRSKLPRRTPWCRHWRGKLCCRTFQVDHGGGGVVLVLMVMMTMMCLHWRGILCCRTFQV